MASLAVMLFVMTLTAAVFFIGIKFNLSNHEVANFILKRCIILFGFFLLSLDIAMLSTIAEVGGLGLSNEVFRLLWLANWGIYLFEMYLVVSTIILGLRMWSWKKKQRRYGYE